MQTSLVNQKIRLNNKTSLTAKDCKAKSVFAVSLQI